MADHRRVGLVGNPTTANGLLNNFLAVIGNRISSSSNGRSRPATLRLKIDVDAEECRLVVKGGRLLLDQLSNANADYLHAQATVND